MPSKLASFLTAARCKKVYTSKGQTIWYTAHLPPGMHASALAVTPSTKHTYVASRSHDPDYAVYVSSGTHLRGWVTWATYGDFMVVDRLVASSLDVVKLLTGLLVDKAEYLRFAFVCFQAPVKSLAKAMGGYFEPGRCGLTYMTTHAQKAILENLRSKNPGRKVLPNRRFAPKVFDGIVKAHARHVNFSTTNATKNTNSNDD